MVGRVGRRSGVVRSLGAAIRALTATLDDRRPRGDGISGSCCLLLTV